MIKKNNFAAAGMKICLVIHISGKKSIIFFFKRKMWNSQKMKECKKHDQEIKLVKKNSNCDIYVTA